MYGGNGIFPTLFKISKKFSSGSKLIIHCLESGRSNKVPTIAPFSKIICSPSLGFALVFSMAYQLFPPVSFWVSPSKHCLISKASTFAPVLLCPIILTGITFVSFKTSTSPFFRYSTMLKNFPCSIVPVCLFKTSKRDSSRTGMGCCAISSRGNS